ncbi:hypothetical protein ES705_30339 [subsurface metagenome]
MKIINALTPLVAIIAVSLVVVYALSKGIDGAVLMPGLAIIGGLGGYQLKKIKDTITTTKTQK